MPALRSSDGKVTFVERGRIFSFLLPCGQCWQCRLERSRQWAVRCVHEAQMHKSNCFITLTYDDAHIPKDYSLHYPHYQDFMRRLRYVYRERNVRFYMCGEYGEITRRPHYHACLFNVNFEDRRYWKTDDGMRVDRSLILDRLWPMGHAAVGDVTFESAAYVARYIMEKMTGDKAAKHYEVIDDETGEIFNRVPEFTHMSLKPGIGAGWYERFKSDVYPEGKVVVRGKKTNSPKYYDRRFEKEDPEAFERLKLRRIELGRERAEDNTPYRRLVKEEVVKARVLARNF